jgi:hypothetical protein
MFVKPKPSLTALRLRELRRRKARGVDVLSVEVDTQELARVLEAAELTPPDFPLSRQALEAHAALFIRQKIEELKCPAIP